MATPRIVKIDEIPSVITDVNVVTQRELDIAYTICEDLERLCHDLNGVGLTAPQCSIPLNLFVVNAGYSQYWVNAKYYPVGERQFWSQEGCLSLPGKIYSVLRHGKIRVEGYLLEKLNDKVTALYQNLFIDISEPIKIVVMQHEIDHTTGILISDKGILFENKTT